VRQAFNRHRLALLLTAVGLLLWSFSLLQAELEIGSYGLISSLPITFFISLAVLTVASALLWASRESHSRLLMLQLVILIIALYFTPYCLEGTPRIPASYQSFGFTDYILRVGHINPKMVWYHSWPGFSLLFASLFEIAGIDNPLPTMSLFPTVIIFLYLLPLFLLFRNTIGSQDNRWWAAAWIFSIANWTEQNYFCPQAVAYLLLLYMLFLAFKNREAGMKAVSYSALFLLIFASLTITHMVTSIICVIMTGALLIIWRRRINMIALVTTMVVAWTIYGATQQFEVFLPNFIEQAFKEDIFFLYVFTMRFNLTSPEHAFVNITRVIFTATFLIIGLLGALFPPSEKRLSKLNIAFMAIALGPVLLVPVLMYGGEFLIRVFLLLLVPIAYFGCKLVRGKYIALLLVLILIMCLPFSIIARYGNEASAYIRPDEISASDFFFNKAKKSEDVLLISSMPPSGFKEVGGYRINLLWPHIKYKKDPLNTIYEEHALGEVVYVYLSQRTHNMYSFTFGEDTKVPEAKAWLDRSTYYNLIYTNLDSNIYISE
jgi:hypothetical protein